MKNACIRLRSCNDSPYKVQNNLLQELDINEVSLNSLIEFEKRLLEFRYKKIFDTHKI